MVSLMKSAIFHLEMQSFVFECQKSQIGVLICEDQWIDGPITKLRQLNVDILISLNASPFQTGKHQDRLNICKNYASEFEISYIYVNMVGGQDEVVFDGNSFVLDSKGSLVKQLPEFREHSTHFILKTLYKALSTHSN